jgi:PIN domain nuclease of toxin-antitoxin system
VDILLDTHVALWWADNQEVLLPDAVAAITDGSNSVWFSAASAWELAIKVRSGKLSVDVSRLVNQLTQHDVRILGVGIDDAISAGALDWTHRDPFDRMLVAQARRLGMLLATRDDAAQRFLGANALPA